MVVISGNHDNPDRLSAASPLTNEQGIHLIGYPTNDLIHVDVSSASERLSIAASLTRLKQG